MKILIAVASCADHLNRNTAVMETWARGDKFLKLNGHLPHDVVKVKIFTGRDFGISDEYKDLPAKVKAICEYASDNGFDYAFKSDSDTFVWMDRLLGSGFEVHDYTGWTGGTVPPHAEYASGGAGYWLSRKAFEIVAKAPLNADTSEDRWVGRVLYDAGIMVHRDVRYGVPSRWNDPGLERSPFKEKEFLTWHPCSVKWMYELWKHWNA